ncbi:Asp23/Gls24 family envelope stress response protein [Nonomuraea sp. B12E4]|uniref:Asp23/Gls24 family envelope stress response protein n=1 Tax=Nonomuraea sp. B12E4 TaxID=3153564 RepID=UPI00325DD686
MTEALAERTAQSSDNPDPDTEHPDLSAEHSDAMAGDSGLDPAAEPADAPDGTETSSAGVVVKGRIKVADEVVEKIASLAALEVPGVADMGGDLARAFESVRDRIGIGSRRGNQGVNAHIQDREASVSLTIVVEYGHVVMEVAAAVKTNVARNVSHMLGMRVEEVNVTVDDVRLPGDRHPSSQPAADDEDQPAGS